MSKHDTLQEIRDNLRRIREDQWSLEHQSSYTKELGAEMFQLRQEFEATVRVVGQRIALRVKVAR